MTPVSSFSTWPPAHVDYHLVAPRPTGAHSGGSEDRLQGLNKSVAAAGASQGSEGSVDGANSKYAPLPNGRNSNKWTWVVRVDFTFMSDMSWPHTFLATVRLFLPHYTSIYTW